MAILALSSSQFCFAQQNKLTLDNGITLSMVKEGSGVSPTSNSKVTVLYKGTFLDGKVFDESSKPITFRLSEVIPCWTISLQKMKQGGVANIYCPSNTAYGVRGAGNLIPPNTPLNFNVTLISSSD